MTAVNDAPVAVDDTATTDEDTAVTINVLGNDTDVDGDAADRHGRRGHGARRDGTAVINADGTITFTPGRRTSTAPPASPTRSATARRQHRHRPP